MYGDNPIRPPRIGDGMRLDIQSIFATLQGEGIYAGVPAIFIRLGGCNLNCSFCDTEFESFSELGLEQIIAKVGELAGDIYKLVVITGGEPLRQPIEKLCELLVTSGFKVQIETNGTLYRELPQQVEIICSPKSSSQGYFEIRSDLLSRINAFKFLISADLPGYRDVPDVGQGGDIPIYLQPIDQYDKEKNRANNELAIELVKKYGYRLSVQIHKIVGID